MFLVLKLLRGPRSSDTPASTSTTNSEIPFNNNNKQTNRTELLGEMFDSKAKAEKNMSLVHHALPESKEVVKNTVLYN